jgi:MATE family multidrug resistance protein
MRVRQRVVHNVAATLRLALPVVATRASLLILVAVDIAMTGHAGQAELAYLGIGIAPQVMLLLVGMGTLYGTAVLVAQADGAGEASACGAIWRVALVHAAAIGSVLGALCFAGEAFLTAIGQAPDVAAGGGVVLRMFAWGMPAMLLAVATWLFLEGIGRPLPGAVVMVAANVVNAGLNWMFIYGNGGAPALGAEGAVLATTVVRWLMALGLIAYALTMPGNERYGVRGPVRGAWARGRTLRRIGLPFAIAQGMESGAFSAVVLLAGYIGTASLGGYQIAQNLIALVYMSAIGIATASAVRVGNAVGRSDPSGVRWAGWTGTALVAVIMSAIGILFAVAPVPLVRVYTSDPEVLAVAVPTVVIAAWVLAWDGAQGVLMGILRGVGDVWVPVAMHAFAFWGVMVPAGAWFAFRTDLAASGLMAGALCGVITASILLGARFAVVSGRPIHRL